MAQFNPLYKINLLDVFNRNYSGKPIEIQRQLRILIRDQSFKDFYSRSLIDKIITRTESGLSKDGKQFAFYSKSYSNSLEFKIYGKEKTKPNLTLTGEMLSSLVQMNSIQPNMIYIGLIGENNKNKAQGHVSGLYGKNKGPKRDFLGLPKSEEDATFKSILDDYASSNIDLNQFIDEASIRAASTGKELIKQIGFNANA